MATNDEPYTVLVADDDPLVRSVIAALLKSFGAEVVAEAEDGKSAIKAFDKYRPDITFLDINMPIKNGMEVLAEIVEMSPTAAVVMLTAVSDMEVADACVEAGAKGYIRKGASPEALKLLLQAQMDNLKVS